MRHTYSATLFLVGLSLTGCAEERSQSHLLDQSSTSITAIPAPDEEARLTSQLTLSHGSAQNQNGWTVFSWTSPSQGTATLEHFLSGFKFRTVRLHLQPGDGAIVMTPEQRFVTSGQVKGGFFYTCGPQGTQCWEDVPQVSGDITYPCGPQGATCTIKIPRPSSPQVAYFADDDTYICGPQGARCPKPKPSTPSDEPKPCGPQGARC